MTEPHVIPVPEIPVHRIPRQPWGRVWTLTVVLVLLGGAGLELFVRARGYEPSLKDDPYSWAWQRGRVADRSPRTVAVLGGSRVLLAFDAAAFRAAAPSYTPVQLAVNGTQPVAALRDLAADDEFRGIVIVDIAERGFLPAQWETQAEEVTAYHRRHRAPGAMIERRLATWVQTHVAIVSAAGVRALDSLARSGSWPPPRYVVTHADRTRYADFRLASPEKMARAALAETRYDPNVIAPDSELDQRVAEAMQVEPAVAAIRARGGTVVYLRMPTCGTRWAVDEAMYPKAKFWDRLAAQTRATTIHFRDNPTLAAFECPDQSHLDSKDAAAFTRALVDILVARGVIAR